MFVHQYVEIYNDMLKELLAMSKKRVSPKRGGCSTVSAAHAI